MAADGEDAAVEQILTAVGPLPAGRRPVLVVLVGLPGSGKTRLARMVRERTGAVVLESDYLRRLLFGRPTYSQEESRTLFRAVHAAADRLLERGAAVILDATNLLEREREPLYAIAERRGARLVLVRLVAPRWLTHRRLRARQVAAGDEYSEAGIAVYERMRFAEQPIGRDHIVVDTSKDVRPAVDRIVEEMEGT